MTSPLRCHLLIGPPASGKSTIAHLLAPLVEAELLSTDEIRAELHGDAAIQGEWQAVEQRLHHALQRCVAADRPVLIDATHARRPWRLALTQRLELSRPVEWIAWWVRTPVEVCLAWNRGRSRQVPEPVIRRQAAALAHSVFAPERSEGFAAVVELDPSAADADTQLRRAIEAGLTESQFSPSRSG
jgi:predicted kinase